MSIPRLPFLYPHLFKSPRAWSSNAPGGPLSAARNRRRVALIHNSSKISVESFTQRYGPAAEPTSPHDGEGVGKEGAPKPRAKAADTKSNRQPSKPKTSGAKEKVASTPAKDADTVPKVAPPQEPTSDRAAMQNIRDADESHPKETSDTFSVNDIESKGPAPLEKVLLMEAPTSPKSDDHKTPHMQPTPYIHHFDTYTLVKDLGKGTFTEDQSITIMKAVRSLLAVNLDLAKDGLVSKSDVENETYLFRAACSELRTEIQNTRKRTSESQRAERTHLQHETDILNQKVTQESQTLKDDLKGMFDDRKMAVRMEQRGMDSKIQELNYKITTALMGDSKGEVEALRWFLTRRAAIVIASGVLCAILYLRYTTHIAHLEDLERKKNLSASSSSGTSTGTTFTTPSRSVGTQTGPGGRETALEVEGSNYVGLG